MVLLSCLLRIGADAAVPGEQNPSDDQVVQAPAHSSYPRVVGRGLRDDHEAAAIAGGSTWGEVEEREITNNVGRIVLRPRP